MVRRQKVYIVADINQYNQIDILKVCASREMADRVREKRQEAWDKMVKNKGDVPHVAVLEFPVLGTECFMYTLPPPHVQARGVSRLLKTDPSIYKRMKQIRSIIDDL